jgi:UPF0755 protein
MKRILPSAAAALLAVLLALYLLPAGKGEPSRFQVQKGHSVRDVARELQAEGLLRTRWTFLLGSKIFRHKSIRPGIYDIPSGASGLTIYRQFLKGPPKVRVMFPEGWTARQMASQLEARGVCPGADFLAAVDKEKREGYLFPDTYFFEQGLPAPAIVERLVERFREKAPADFKEQARVLRLSYGQLVTLASIVEREARVAQERPLIAGVFYNRLRKHWHLESCATVEYALGGWKPHLTYKDLAVESPYNTYRHAGLPPGPICNPGQAALEAASHPAKTDMLFFVADGQGAHHFSRDYEEHLAVQKHGNSK